MSTRENANNKPGEYKRGSGDFLKRKWWLGVGAIVGLVGVIIATITLMQGSDNSPKQSVRANDGNCVIQAGNGNTCSVNQIQSSHATSSPSMTLAQMRMTDCQTLTKDAGKESNQLLTLKTTIFIDDPTSRVIGHTSGFTSAYNEAFSLMQIVRTDRDKFESDHGVINVDPQLDGDLNDMASDLPSLHEAVVARGIGGVQWNQLYNYSQDFSLLAGLKCVL